MTSLGRSEGLRDPGLEQRVIIRAGRQLAEDTVQRDKIVVEEEIALDKRVPVEGDGPGPGSRVPRGQPVRRGHFARAAARSGRIDRQERLLVREVVQVRPEPALVAEE